MWAPPQLVIALLMTAFENAEVAKYMDILNNDDAIWHYPRDVQMSIIKHHSNFNPRAVFPRSELFFCSTVLFRRIAVDREKWDLLQEVYAQNQGRCAV